MTFVVMGLGTVFNALTNRRDPASGLAPPILKALGDRRSSRSSLIFLATELPGLQKGLLTTSLTGPQWLACIGLALLLPLVIEASKWIRRRRAPSVGRARPAAGAGAAARGVETVREHGTRLDQTAESRR